MHRTSLTLPLDVADYGYKQAAARGFRNSFSAYVAWLIERDNAVAGSPKLDKPLKVAPNTDLREEDAAIEAFHDAREALQAPSSPPRASTPKKPPESQS